MAFGGTGKRAHGIHGLSVLKTPQLMAAGMYASGLGWTFCLGLRNVCIAITLLACTMRGLECSRHLQVLFTALHSWCIPPVQADSTRVADRVAE